MRFIWCLRLLACVALAGIGQAAAAAAPSMPAASFTCSNGQGVAEQVICSDPLLRQADADLAAAYHTARAAAANKDGLRSDERSWILRRNDDCGVNEYTIITGGNRAGFIDCFLDEYAERHADLVQMTLHPERDPRGVSLPIRQSFRAAGAAPAVPADITLSTFQTPGKGATAALAWADDDTLLVLQTKDGGGDTIYRWRQGALPTVLAADPRRRGFTDPAGHALPLPAGAAGAAGAVGAMAQGGRIIITGGGATLDLGPVATGAIPRPRFVSLATATGLVQVAPPIRIDSRFHLTASYAAFTGQFVVSPADSAVLLSTAEVRRWSKTDCLAYWLVSATTGMAQPACIPFADYETAVPIPYLSKNAVYLNARGHGLYRILDGIPHLVIAGDFSTAAVAPDGCAIALAVRNGAAASGTPMLQIGGDNTITVLSVCRPKVMPVTATMPATP